MFKLILTALLALCAIAGELTLESGFIQAKTEVFGDSNINPSTNHIDSNVYINNSIESINGTIQIKTLDLRSDNIKRDNNMYKLLNSALYPTIMFQINQLIAHEKMHNIQGILTLNGITKEVTSQVTVKEENNRINLFGHFFILLSDFGMTPPSMLFLNVRDKIDIIYNLHYTRK